MSIDYLFELGGENTNVARYEVETVLECEGYNPNEVFNQLESLTSSSLDNLLNKCINTLRIG